MPSLSYLEPEVADLHLVSGGRRRLIDLNLDEVDQLVTGELRVVGQGQSYQDTFKGVAEEMRHFKWETSFAEGYHRTLHDAPPFADDEAAAAIDTMLAALRDRRHRDHYRSRLQHTNSQSQRARIRWLTKRALDVVPGWGLDPSVVAAEAVDTRNWLTHWGDRGPRVQEGDALALLSSRLYVSLAVNLLLELGLRDEDVAHQIAGGLRVEGLP